MKIQSQLHIKAPAPTVWRVVAHEFADIGRWASSIARSTPNQEAEVPVGAAVGGRVCEVPSFGHIKETFIHYDEERMTFTYLADGGPFFMESASNGWTVTPFSETESTVFFDAEMILKPGWHIIMALPMRWQINKILRETTEELKYYIETGSIHPRKQAQRTSSNQLAV